MNKYFFTFALTGWMLALAAHCLSLADVDVRETIPFIWILHIGIFIAFIPAIIEVSKDEELKQYYASRKGKAKNPIVMGKRIFKNAPSWVIVLAIAGFFYAILNFMLFMGSQPGGPSLQDGQFVLQNHGKIIRVITEAEYHHYQANEVRGFSGHWIAFYGIAAAILFPVQKN